MKRQGGRRGIFPDEWFACVSWGAGVQASCDHDRQHALQGDGYKITLPMSALERRPGEAYVDSRRHV